MKKNFKETALTLLSKAALSTSKKEANSACICIGYQPKMPESVAKFKKNI
ncbi:cyclic lactone autoinducer peptide [Lacrimispora sp.]|nr:cyclic lactone autoinducer peptide [Lacrimispora sp.]